MSFRIGVDIGGTTMSAGVVDLNNKIVCRVERPTLSAEGAGKVLARTVKMVNELVEKSGIEVKNIKSLGIGCPGEFDNSRDVVTFSNNLGWENIPLKNYMKSKFLLPVALENDAACAALGEHAAGAGQCYNTMLMVTLGTGIGGGLIVNNKLFSGSSGGAGIIGHMVVHSGGIPCNCGRKGCWEVYASVNALIHQAKQKAAEIPTSELAQILIKDKTLSGKTIFAAVKRGDNAAKQVFEKYVEHIAEGMTSLVNIFDPDVIIVGGGISKEKDFLLEPVRQFVNKYKYCRNASSTKIFSSALGNDAGIIGAACLGAN